MMVSERTHEAFENDLDASIGPSPDVFRARLVDGLRMRARAAETLLSNGPGDETPIEQQRPSVFGVLMERHDPQRTAPAPYEGDDRWAYVSAILTAPSLEAQRPLAASIVPPQDEAFVTLYAVGALFGEGTIAREALDLLDASDLSIVLETLAVADVLPPSLRNQGLELNLLDLLPLSPVARAAYEIFRQRVRQNLPERGGDGLVGFRRSIHALKQDYVHIFGPDLFSALQAMTEPALLLSASQLERLQALCDRWGLRDVFVRLLVLRLAGTYDDEQAYLRQSPDLLDTEFPALLGLLVQGALAGSGEVGPSRARSGDYFHAAALLLVRFRAALDRRDASRLIDAVIALYALDAALVEFLPWNRISRAVSALDTPDYRTAFLTYLMTEDEVRRRFPMVAMQFGKGALIADLMGLVNTSGRGDRVISLLNRISELPGPAASALTRAVLDRAIMERLASTLEPPGPRLPGTERHRISLLTLSALRAASQKDLVPPSEAHRRFGREIDTLRFDLLQGQYRTGRVRVAWTELSRDLADRLAQNLPLEAMELGVGTAASGLTPRLAAYSAQEITTFLLQDSEYGINQALSSSLRHGVILPRYLRAFDDALQAAWTGKGLISWDDRQVRLRLGEEGRLVVELRERVSDLVKDFMDRWLTADATSRLAAALQANLRERLTLHFQAGRPAHGPMLRRTIISAAKVELRRFLSEAARALTEEVRRPIVAELKALRRAVKGGNHEMKSCVDSLETCLFPAHDEVRRWTQPVTRLGPALPFTLNDVVKFHLLSTALHDRDRLRIEALITIDGRPRPARQIKGQYLPFFEEVVRNLLSNALKGSGDELKTEAVLRLAISNGKMILSCSNAINAAEVATVIARHPDTVAQAQKRSASQAQKDHKSGFQKIRLAYKRAFALQPAINIPPISRRRPRFVIELEIPLPSDGLFVSEGHL